MRQLEYLIGIAEQGSITACAEHFGVSQPAVTKQIRLLEERFSCTLLERSVRGTTLTEVGEKMVRQARVVLEEFNLIPLIVEEAKQSIIGEVVLGVSPLLSVQHFSRMYFRLHRDFPDIRIKMVEIEPQQLTEEVQKNRVDLGLMPLPLFSEDLQYEELWREELVVISSPHEGLEDSVTLASVRNRNFVSLTPGFSLNLSIADLARQEGFEPNIVREASGIHSLLGFVASGIGIAIVPRNILSLRLKHGLIRVSHLLPAANRVFIMTFPRQREVNPAIDVVAHYIRLYTQNEHEIETLIAHSTQDRPTYSARSSMQNSYN